MQRSSAPQKKIGMLFTYTNRSKLPVLAKTQTPSYSNLVRIPATRQSMFSIIHTPASSCSTCGH